MIIIIKNHVTISRMVYHLGQHECVLPGHDHSRLAQNKSFLIRFGARAVCFLLTIPTLLYRWRNWDEEWPCLLLIIWFTKPILAVGGRPTTVQSSPTPCSCPSLCSCCIPFTEELKHWFPLGMERRRNRGEEKPGITTPLPERHRLALKAL